MLVLVDHFQKSMKAKKAPFNKSELEIVRKYQVDMVQRPLFFSTVLSGISYALTKPYLSKAPRLAFLTFSFGTGIYLGVQSSSSNFIQSFYSLPDSTIAKEGRELLKQKFPTSPLLKELESNLAKHSSALGNSASSDATFTDSFSQDISFDEKNQQDFSQLTADDQNLPKVAVLENRNKKIDQRNSNFSSSTLQAPNRYDDLKKPQEDQDINRFHGEDIFSDWSEPIKEVSSSKDENVNKKNSNQLKSWDDIRLEYQNKQQNQRFG